MGEQSALGAGTRLAVFSIRNTRTGTKWVRVGTAFVNKDGSFNVALDVLPLNGRLHVRETSDPMPAASSGEEGGEPALVQDASP